MTLQPAAIDQLPLEEVLRRLSEWDVNAIGLHPDGSNYVFVIRLSDGNSEMYAIYKPSSGERPLRDFPYGTLHNREWAAFRVATALGWPNVPPTVIRDGPHGEGSVQLYVDADFSRHYFNERDNKLTQFEPVAMFDVLINNADRKGGACLIDANETVWAVDHGLTFNPLARRRSVMFEFNAMRYNESLLSSVSNVRCELRRPGSGLTSDLASVLDGREVDSLVQRCDEMIETGHFPTLDPNYNVPWPMV